MPFSDDLEAFLKTVDLRRHRAEYTTTKTVEMNMIKAVRAIPLLYDVYWRDKQLLTFDEFYPLYHARRWHEIVRFGATVKMDIPSFNLGLRARTYRTWTALLTQIHAGYVAQDVFGSGAVEMSPELDYAKIDIRVNYNGGVIDFQVKKESYRPEAIIKRVGDNSKSSVVTLSYTLLSQKVLDEPRKRDGDFKAEYRRFYDNPHIKLLENGFVIFKPSVFEESKRKLEEATGNIG